MINKNNALITCFVSFCLLLSIGASAVDKEQVSVPSKDARHDAAINNAKLLLVDANTFDASVQKNWPSALLNLSKLLKPEGSDLAWNFKQFRYLKLLKRPIATEGRLDVTLKGKNIAVNWKVEKPVTSEFRIEDGKVKQKKKGEWKGLSSAEQPAFVFVSNVMNQALLGDFSALSEHFHIYFLAKESNAWAIGLKPKDAKSQLADMIQYIALTGTTYQGADIETAELNQVIIMDVRGEASLIELQTIDIL